MTDLYRQHYIGLGLEKNFGPGTLKFGGKYITRKNHGKNDIKGEENNFNVWSLGTGYIYRFSKRTHSWSYAGYAQGGQGWKEEKNILFNGWQVGLGLVHQF